VGCLPACACHDSTARSSKRAFIVCLARAQVQQQGEMALRIEDNVDGTLENVNQAQAQLLKYLNTISSNRWLILKARLLTGLLAARPAPAAPAPGPSRVAPLRRAAAARPPRACRGSQHASALLRQAGRRQDTLSGLELTWIKIFIESVVHIMTSRQSHRLWTAAWRRFVVLIALP